MRTVFFTISVVLFVITSIFRCVNNGERESFEEYQKRERKVKKMLSNIKFTKPSAVTSYLQARNYQYKQRKLTLVDKVKSEYNNSLLILVGAMDESKENYSPLLFDTYSGDIEKLKASFKNKTKIKLKKSRYDSVLLLLAVYKDRNEIVKFFLKAGVKFKRVFTDEIILLNLAVANENIDITKMLLKRRVNVNKAGVKYGLTPLMLAQLGYENTPENTLEMTKVLIKAGARVNKKDKKGKTALDYALNRGNKKVIAFLKKYGAKKRLKLKSFHKKSSPFYRELLS